MRRLTIIVFLLISTFAYAQNETGYPENYVPHSIADAIHYLNRTWSDEDKERVRNMPEDSALAQLHHGTGTAIRNSWGFWDKKKNSLVKELESYDISHPDEKSWAVLSLFHKQLNDPDFDIKKELLKIKAHDKELKNKEAAFDREQKRRYRSLSVGDTVRVPFTVLPIGVLSIIADEVRLGIYSNRSGFGFDDFDCIVTGTVKKKNQNYSLTIEINDIWFKNEENATINTQKKIGDVFDYDMRHSVIITE